MTVQLEELSIKMALSFREVARNDADLLKLLEIADHHSVLDSGVINISDINGIW